MHGFEVFWVITYHYRSPGKIYGTKTFGHLSDIDIYWYVGYDFMNQFESSPNLEHYEIIYHSKICKNSFSSGSGIRPYTCWKLFCSWTNKNLISRHYLLCHELSIGYTMVLQLLIILMEMVNLLHWVESTFLSWSLDLLLHGCDNKLKAKSHWSGGNERVMN